MTERERKELEYKRTLRDLASEYKKAGAKEHEERKNRYYMPEEKRSKVQLSTLTGEELVNHAAVSLGLALSHIVTFTVSTQPIHQRFTDIL